MSAFPIGRSCGPLLWAWLTHLVAHRQLIEGKTVLEIGGGLGLPALVAAALGGQVTATDYLTDAVEFARKNAALNHITNIHFETFDWRKAAGYGQYDVLLASDVAYERSQFEYLQQAFTHLVKPGGLILLSEPNRYIAEPFIADLNKAGYKLERFSYEVMVKAIHSKVSVYAIRS